MNRINGYIVFPKETDKTYLYVSGQVVITYLGTQIIDFSGDIKKLSEIKELIENKSVENKEIKLSEKEVIFLLETGRRFKKLRFRFGKIGDKLLEQILTENR